MNGCTVSRVLTAIWMLLVRIHVSGIWVISEKLIVQPPNSHHCVRVTGENIWTHLSCHYCGNSRYEITNADSYHCCRVLVRNVRLNLSCGHQFKSWDWSMHLVVAMLWNFLERDSYNTSDLENLQCELVTNLPRCPAKLITRSYQPARQDFRISYAASVGRRIISIALSARRGISPQNPDISCKLDSKVSKEMFNAGWFIDFNDGKQWVFRTPLESAWSPNWHFIG